jgi:hypothetical protein
MDNFAERVIAFNKKIRYDNDLPGEIRVMNPFVESPGALRVSSEFYRKFYNDNEKRRLILGINPGRFGGGVTGIPFTDTRRLAEKCGLTLDGVSTHEPSSVFIYELIDLYGGVQKFYSDFYINSPCPLGFVKKNEKGREINLNYYDIRGWKTSLYPFMVDSVCRYISMGTDTSTAFCLGTGKNYRILAKMNEKHGFFGKLVPLEHPRFIMQYRSRLKNVYFEKYLNAFNSTRY